LSPLLRRGVALLALLALLAVSVGAGFLLWRNVLTGYQAVSSIILPGTAVPPSGSEVGGTQQQPGPDVGGAQQRVGVRGLTVRLPEGPTFFRQIEPILASTAAIEQFAESRGLTTDPIVRGFIAQTRAHRTGPASFTFSYGVTRADVRDLPEAFAGEVLRQAPVRFTLVVLTSGRSEAEAGRAEKIFIDYVRDTMQRVAVRDLMNQLVQYARTYTARMDNELSAIRIRLASIDRQLADLEKIRLAHSEGSTSTESDIVSVPNVSSQSEGRRFLSPVRQIVALQTERSELTDRQRVIVSQLAGLKALDSYVVAVQERIRTDSKAIAPLDIASSALNQLAPRPDSPEDGLALANVRAAVNETLVWLRAHLVDQPPEPDEPIVYRAGPSLVNIVGVAALLGFIVWLAVVRGALRGLFR